jgi:hypothetical protein
MKRLAILLGILALFVVGCDGGGWPFGDTDFSLTLKPYDLTGTWSGNVGEIAEGVFQISQDGTDLL